MSAGRRLLASAEVEANGTDQLTVAAHYKAMRDSSGVAVTDQGAVQGMVDHMNQVWSQCHIGFQLENYEEVDPNSLSARFNPANYAELDAMRLAAQSDNYVLIIGTGTWNRAGDLGNSGSNCYSSFPGDSADGIVCEASVAASPTIHAHEIGHWLNLYHTNDPTTDQVDDTTIYNNQGNLMDHFVAPENTALTHGQCVRARGAIATSRRNAVI